MYYVQMKIRPPTQNSVFAGAWSALSERYAICSPALLSSDAGARSQLHFWHLPELCWPAADRTVRILKTVRRCQRERTAIGDKSVAAAGGKSMPNCFRP